MSLLLLRETQRVPATSESAGSASERWFCLKAERRHPQRSVRRPRYCLARRFISRTVGRATPTAGPLSENGKRDILLRTTGASAGCPLTLCTVLDWSHDLTLRAVADGDYEGSPALRTLVANGLVEQDPDGGFAVTAAGRVAREDREPRWMRIVWPVAALVGAVYVASIVVDWLG